MGFSGVIFAQAKKAKLGEKSEKGEKIGGKNGSKCEGFSANQTEIRDVGG